MFIFQERILQLGYRPSSTASSTSSTSTVSSQRRNSLPVQSTLQQQLTRDCPASRWIFDWLNRLTNGLSRPYTKKQKFKRRASLPVIQAPHRSVFFFKCPILNSKIKSTRVNGKPWRLQALCADSRRCRCFGTTCNSHQCHHNQSGAPSTHDIAKVHGTNKWIL